MVFNPNDTENRNIIGDTIEKFDGIQICISLHLSSTISKYDRIEFLNMFLRKITVRCRDINRRNYIDSYLIVLSDNLQFDTRGTIFVKFTKQMLDIDVLNRIRLIESILTEFIKANFTKSGNQVLQDDTCLVFKPYHGMSGDIQRYHYDDISYKSDSLSITQINCGNKLQFSDWSSL